MTNHLQTIVYKKSLYNVNVQKVFYYQTINERMKLIYWRPQPSGACVWLYEAVNAWLDL